MPVLARRLPWVALLLSVVTAAILLFGPLWDDARDENPLDRPSGVAWDLVLQLALPTLMVAGALLVALALPRRPALAVAGVLLFTGALVAAPWPLPLWFLPALLVTAAAVALALRPRSRQVSPARRRAAGTPPRR